VFGGFAPEGRVTAVLDDDVVNLAQGRNWAAFTTLLPSGHPMTHVMWVDADREYVLINTEVHRQKYKNVQRDPRVTVTIIDSDNPIHYAEVRGVVVSTVLGPEARQHIDRLSLKYFGVPYPNRIASERALLKIQPFRQRGLNLPPWSYGSASRQSGEQAADH
jgi:PPOX class probable F420-dependent enzyme